VNLQFLSPAIMDVSFTLDEMRKEALRWPHGQDEITSWCVHVLGFIYGKQEEMPASVVVPSSCHRARGTASLCVNMRCVFQEDSSENDAVFKSSLFFPCGKIFVQLQTCTLIHKLFMFFSFNQGRTFAVLFDWRSHIERQGRPKYKSVKLNRFVRRTLHVPSLIIRLGPCKVRHLNRAKVLGFFSHN